MKLLAKNPVNRYPTAEDLRSDLRRYQEGAHDLRPSNQSGVTSRTFQHAPPVSPVQKKTRVRRDDGFRRTALFTVFMGILLVVFGYLVIQFLDTIGVEDSDDAPVQLSMSEVPNLIGTPLDEAREILREAKLSVQMDYRTNIDYSENTVFDQEPRAGAKLEPAETVRLWVSKGTGPMTLIKVIGDSVGDAVRDLEAMGLRVDTLELEDPVQPAGQIIDQNPVAGSEITPGTRVILFVSKGPAVEQIPDLESRPVLAAMNIISQLGWLASTSEEASETIPEGLVIRTEPPAQSKLSPGSRVEIVISSGLPVITVPSVTSLLEDSAVQILEEEGFQINLIEELLPSESVNDGRVISQSPQPEIEVELGTIVTIIIGRAEIPQQGSVVDQSQ